MSLVKKKDGSIRFCIDYRKLNKVTKKKTHIDDLLDDLADAKWFSTTDLASGYWQVEVSLEDQENTAFTTPHGSVNVLVSLLVLAGIGTSTSSSVSSGSL